MATSMFVMFDKQTGRFFTLGGEWVPERSKALEFCDNFYNKNLDLMRTGHPNSVMLSSEVVSAVVYWDIDIPSRSWVEELQPGDSLYNMLEMEHDMPGDEVDALIAAGLVNFVRRGSFNNTYRYYKFN